MFRVERLPSFEDGITNDETLPGNENNHGGSEKF